MTLRILTASLLFAFAAPAARLAQAVPAQNRPAPSMTVEGEDAEEDASPPIPQGDERRAIGDYIRDNSSEIRDCYAARLRERPTLSGKMVARFDIGPSGRVIGAMADGIADRDLVLCVVTAVRKWEFDKPQSGGKLRVAYPFKFEPQPSK
ncbi:MAG TPA: AgmX/PglI C-terminal domain-containing protein [Myxococcales bacterium]|nr:AgmX/PglI C-terminal domain-containing protein [Myxococcales bacterium]HET9754335.1 AgmX/PglI C-terminal domain-containing protein [Myxococcales bacterium]